MAGRWGWIWAAGLIPALAGCALPGSPQSVAGQLGRSGPAATVADLQKGDGARWQAAVAGIAGGNPDWVALAPKLAEGGGPAAQEQLSYALTAALQTAPEAVLPVLGPTFPLASICKVPTGASGTDRQVWRDQALAALTRVKNAALQPQAVACRQALSMSG